MRKSREGEKKSYYNDPINTTEDRLAGYNRKPGGVSPEVKETVKEFLVRQAKSKGMDDAQIGHLLSIIEHESGFNPDAASSVSSAAGIGQFTNDTWFDHGRKQDKFDAFSNSDVTIDYYLKARQRAIDEGGGGSSVWNQTYRYYHDGLNSIGPESMDSQRTNKKIMGSLPGNQEFLRTLDARARMAEAAGGWSQTEPVEPVNSLDAVPESGGEGAGIRQAGVFGNPFDLGPGIDGTEAVAPDASSADRGGSGGPSYTWAGADALSGKLVDPVGDGRQPRGAWGLRPFRSLGYPGGLPDPRLHLGQDSPSGRSQFSLPAPEQPMRPAAGSPSALEGADGFVLGSSVSGPQELCGQRSRLDAAMRRRAIRWDMK